MITDTGVTGELLDRLRAGDEEARNCLVAHACERLRCLTRRMLKGYPGVHRWEQTGDVLHNALLRLFPALEATTPESVRHFYNLAALEIRRELIDLGRRDRGRTTTRTGRARVRTSGAGQSTGIQTARASLTRWRSGRSFTRRLRDCPTRSGKSSAWCGTAICLKRKRLKCWVSPSER
jgi:hypothetical protein